VKGANVSIIAAGTFDEQVTSGTSHLVVKFGFVTVKDETRTICLWPITCPILAGPFNHALPPQSLPKDSPNGKYTGNDRIIDQSNQQVACINYSFDLA